MLEVNLITTGNDLTGAKITRIRTLAKFLDSANQPSTGSIAQETSLSNLILQESGNEIGLEASNSTAANNEFPREIYFIDRKVSESRELVVFELASISDLAGIRLPKRQCTRDIFPSIGTFV